MADRITIQQLTSAVNLTRYQIDSWISRGYFKPRNQPEKGKARIFTLSDAIGLGAMAGFVRLGLHAADVGPHISLWVYGFTDDRALFAICEGPIKLTSEADAAYMEPDMASTFAKIIRASQLPELLADPEISSFAVVDLSEIEERIQRTLSGN